MTTDYGYVLPDPVNPPKTRCFKVYVPDERYHIAAFMGQMMELTRWYNWARDDAHTGKDAAAVWAKIYEQVRLSVCEDCPPMPSIGASGVENMIRQNPTNPCLLETSIDGTNWCAFADLSKCIGGSLQGQFQPGPTPQPPPGGCSEFDVTLMANNQYLLPVGVGGGDTITITNLTGGWYDGGLDVWRCPDAQEYILGACSGGPAAPASGDKCPTLPHMVLLANDGTNCYNASADFTITSGVPDGTQLVFQANDSDISNNAGSASFHVKICKNTRPNAFYYCLFTNFWAVQQLPSQISWYPIALDTPTTITSLPPADPSHPDNIQTYAGIIYAEGYDSHGFAENPHDIYYKITANSQSGASFDGGGLWAFTNNSSCGTAGTYQELQTAPPALNTPVQWIEIRSRTQFVWSITITKCS